MIGKSKPVKDHQRPAAGGKQGLAAGRMGPGGRNEREAFASPVVFDGNPAVKEEAYACM